MKANLIKPEPGERSQAHDVSGHRGGWRRSRHFGVHQHRPRDRCVLHFFFE
jgi:hypothetical protein